jgi:hypothetical protein
MWNYRVVKTKDEDGEFLEIREVYYDQLGKPMGHCGATVIGDTLGEIETVLQMMAQSLEKAIVKAEDLK